jgi:hypothetical protein
LRSEEELVRQADPVILDVVLDVHTCVWNVFARRNATLNRGYRGSCRQATATHLCYGGYARPRVASCTQRSASCQPDSSVDQT